MPKTGNREQVTVNRGKTSVKAEVKPVEKKLGKFEKIVFDMAGKEVGTVELPKEVFGVEVNRPLLSQALRVYSANTHQGTRAAKTRAEVRGGGRKPWRQKGTGRARQGSIRAPQWRGGGVIFAPKPTDPTLELPTKMRRAALKSALSVKLPDVLVVEAIKVTDGKTKKIATTLTKLGLSGKTLLVLPEFEEKVVRASRNITDLRLTRATDLNAYEVLAAGKIVFDQNALGKLNGVKA